MVYQDKTLTPFINEEGAPPEEEEREGGEGGEEGEGTEGEEEL